MRGTIRRAEELEWVDLPGHINALSKMLITPANSDAQHVDVLISSYAPKGYAAEHQHEESENVFYFISGSGLFILDGERHLIEPHMVVHVPPKVRHSIINTGFENLVFMVAISPPGDK